MDFSTRLWTSTGFESWFFLSRNGSSPPIFFTYLRGSAYVYPVILSLHMLALALFGGMVLTTDLRLLGLAMRSSPVSNVLYQLRTAKRYGLLLMVTCGILLAACKAEEYYYNIFFHAKLALIAFFIVHALVFRRTVYNRAGEIDTTGRIPWTAKLAAGLSLILRTAIVCMGRGIGYTEPPPGIHAQLWPF